MRQLMLLLSLIGLLWSVPAHAAPFFDADFEGACAPSGTTPVGNDWFESASGACSGAMAVSSEQHLSGSKSLKLNYVTRDNTQCVTPCPSINHRLNNVAHTHLFVRLGHYLSSGFQVGPGNTKMLRLKDQISSYPILWIMVRNTGNYGICMEGPWIWAGSTECIDAVAPNKGNWEQIELEWKLNTPGQSNGILRMWVNGFLRIDRTGRQDVGPTPTSQKSGLVAPNSSNYRLTSSQLYLQSGVGQMYYDRIAFGNTAIGQVGGAPPVGDTTPPSPPTIVGVN